MVKPRRTFLLAFSGLAFVVFALLSIHFIHTHFLIMKNVNKISIGDTSSTVVSIVGQPHSTDTIVDNIIACNYYYRIPYGNEVRMLLGIPTPYYIGVPRLNQLSVHLKDHKVVCLKYHTIFGSSVKIIPNKSLQRKF